MITEVHPFYIPIYKVSIADWHKKQNQLLNLVSWDDTSCWQDEHFTDYHKNHKNGCSYLAKFCNLIEPELEQIVQQLHHNIHIDLLWAQRYFDADYMGVHNHGATGYSCVLYAEFNPADHQATQFTAPFNNFVSGSALQYIPEVNEGDMIVFPSALLHCALPSMSATARTIFSFNMRLTERNHDGDDQ